jgi:hypothetical protein
MIPPNESNNHYSHDDFEDWLIDLLNEIDAEDSHIVGNNDTDEFNAYMYLQKKGLLNNDLYGD